MPLNRSPSIVLRGLGFCAACAWVLACAHGPPSGGLPTLRPVAEAFLERVRWRDFDGAAQLLISDRRAPFKRARERLGDDRELSITDYEMGEAELHDGGMAATVKARISWFRLPSTFEHTELVVSRFVFEDGSWLLSSQTAGPFLPELAP